MYIKARVSHHIGHAEIGHIKQDCRSFHWRLKNEAPNLHGINRQFLSLLLINSIFIVILNMDYAEEKMCQNDPVGADLKTTTHQQGLPCLSLP